MIKLVLDTDIGSDIDDAFALVYLLKSNGVNLAGVGTTYRNSLRRGKLAKSIIAEYCDEDIPVFAGVDLPLSQIPEETEPAWAEQNYDENGNYLPSQCLDEYMSAGIREENAVTELIKLLKRDKDLQILAIGPLTNVALAVRLCPEVFRNRKITVMAGCLNKLVLDEQKGEQYVAEWNVLADPEAANIVFTSGADITMIGLDAALKCRMNKISYDRIFADRQSQILSRLLAVWKKSFKTEDLPILYDPVSAVSVTNPGIFRFERHRLKVCLKGKDRGVIKRSKKGNIINVAVDVDADVFLKIFTDTTVG